MSGKNGEAIITKHTWRDDEARRAKGIRFLAKIRPDKYKCYYHEGRLTLCQKYFGVGLFSDIYWPTSI
jgi:hypothetical protein